jgi:hypothetical protein
MVTTKRKKSWRMAENTEIKKVSIIFCSWLTSSSHFEVLGILKIHEGFEWFGFTSKLTHDR